MALQYSVGVRNARLNAVETTIGVSPVLHIRSGAAPANCAATDTGTLLASMTLPSDFMSDAASGEKAKLGTWEDPSADANGTAGHFRIKDSTGTTCHIQGSCGAIGSSSDLELNNVAIAITQPVSISTFTITGGNA